MRIEISKAILSLLTTKLTIVYLVENSVEKFSRKSNGLDEN